jgi:hypothetical protein
MLLTVFEETNKNNSMTKRKRDPLSDRDRDREEGGDGETSEPPPKKIHIDGIENHNETDVPPGNRYEIANGNENENNAPYVDDSENIAVDQSKLIVTKLLHAFGMSVLGAVRSLTTHNEVDMSLGIAGLYSLKMEKGRSFDNMVGITEDSPDRPNPSSLQRGVAPIPGGHVTHASTSSHNTSKQSHPHHQYPPTHAPSEDPLQSADSSQTDLDQSCNSTDAEKSAATSSSPPSYQLSRTNRSMSVNSTTTTEEILSQDSQEESCFTDYPSKHPDAAAVSGAIQKTAQLPSITKMFPFDRSNRGIKQEALPVPNKVEFYSNGWSGGTTFENIAEQGALSGHSEMIAAPGGSIEVLSPSAKQCVTTE